MLGRSCPPGHGHVGSVAEGCDDVDNDVRCCRQRCHYETVAATAAAVVTSAACTVVVVVIPEVVVGRLALSSSATMSKASPEVVLKICLLMMALTATHRG